MVYQTIELRRRIVMTRAIFTGLTISEKDDRFVVMVNAIMPVSATKNMKLLRKNDGY